MSTNSWLTSTATWAFPRHDPATGRSRTDRRMDRAAVGAIPRSRAVPRTLVYAFCSVTPMRARGILPWGRSFPFLIYILALIVRLAPVLLSRGMGIGLDDMFQYDMLARSLAAGNGFRWYAPSDLGQIVGALRSYGVTFDEASLPTDPRGIPTSFRAPLYPAFLSVVYSASGMQHRFLAARMAQALLTASLAPLAYGLALKMGAREKHARWAGWVPALWPMLVLFPLGLATENLFQPLVAAGVLALCPATTSRRWRWQIAAGILFGLAVLTRSVIVVFPIVVTVWLWIRGDRRTAAALIACLVLLTLPWSVRNSLLHGKPTFVETSLGYNLYLGYHPDGDGSFVFGPSLDLIPILDDAERDARGRDLALEFIRENPWRLPGLMLSRFAHLWGLEDRVFAYFYSNGFLGRLPPALVVVLFLVLVLPLPLLAPLSLLGMASDRQNAPWTIAVLLLASYTAVHTLVMAEERFHLVMVPLLAALAARGLSHGKELLARIRQGDPGARRRVLLAAALMALLLLGWGHELIANSDRLAMLFGPDGATAHFDY